MIDTITIRSGDLILFKKGIVNSVSFAETLTKAGLKNIWLVPVEEVRDIRVIRPEHSKSG